MGFSFWSLGHGRFPTTQSARDLAGKASRNGVDFVTCFVGAESMFFSPAALIGGKLEPGGPESYPYELLNRQHLRECVWFGERRLLPFLCFDPLREVAPQLALIRELAPAIFGLKCHTLTTASTPRDAQAAGFLAMAGELDLPVLFHTGRTPENCRAELVVEVAAECPNVRISIAHLGGFVPEVLAAIAEMSNLFTDCSPFLANLDEIAREGWEDAQTYLSAPPSTILADLHDALPASLLWGTDEPWTAVAGPHGEMWSMHTYADEVSVLRATPPAIQTAIAHQTPLRWLFGDIDQAQAVAQITRRLDALADLMPRL